MFNWRKSGIQGISRAHLEEMLNEQADAMLSEGPTAEPTEAYPPHTQQALDAMYSLARDVYSTFQALPGGQPSRAFVAKLKASLRESYEEQTVRKAERTQRSPVMQFLGVALSVLAVVALIVQIASSILIVVSFISGLTRRRSTAAI